MYLCGGGEGGVQVEREKYYGQGRERERTGGGGGRERAILHVYEVCITQHKHVCVHNECYRINKFQIQLLILAIQKQRILL